MLRNNVDCTICNIGFSNFPGEDPRTPLPKFVPPQLLSGLTCMRYKIRTFHLLVKSTPPQNILATPLGMYLLSASFLIDLVSCHYYCSTDNRWKLVTLSFNASDW